MIDFVILVIDHQTKNKCPTRMLKECDINESIIIKRNNRLGLTTGATKVVKMSTESCAISLSLSL